LLLSNSTLCRYAAAGADATLPPDIARALRQGAAAEAAKRNSPPPAPPDLHKVGGLYKMNLYA
jgi:hypothetical protein